MACLQLSLCHPRTQNLRKLALINCSLSALDRSHENLIANIELGLGVTHVSLRPNCPAVPEALTSTVTKALEVKHISRKPREQPHNAFYPAFNHAVESESRPSSSRTGLAIQVHWLVVELHSSTIGPAIAA